MTIAYQSYGIPAEMLPTGAIVSWGGDPAAAVPPGWLLCDGTPVSRSKYGKLFSTISTTYGSGDGSTTFHLPDLTDKYLYGHETAAGTTGGSDTHDHPFTTSVQLANVAGGAHNHSSNAGAPGAAGASHNHNVNATNAASGNSTSNTGKSTGNGVSVQGSAHGHTIYYAGLNAASASHNHPWNAIANSGALSNSADHSDTHTPNANINNTLLSQKTYQASSSTMSTGPNDPSRTLVRGIIKA